MWLLLALALAGMAPGEEVARIALLSGTRNAALEQYLNARLASAMREDGIARIEVQAIGDYDRFVTDSAYGRYQFFKGSPLTFAAARQQGAYRALLKSSYAGTADYTAVIVAHRARGINAPADLIGKKVLFLNRFSASGYLYPRLFLLDHGITTAMFVKPPFNPKYVRGHEDIMREVNDGWYDAGCTCLNVVDAAKYPNVKVLATLPRPIPADLLFADVAFARTHPAFTAALVECWWEWSARRSEPMVRARDEDYREVERRWALLARYDAAERRVAARSPERLRDVSFVKGLYLQARLRQALPFGLYAFLAACGLAALLVLLRRSRLFRRLCRVVPAAPDARTVFISHASKDRDAAERLVAALEDRGVRCWIAPRDVPAGADYAAAIVDAIDRGAALVVLLSAAADGSPHVRREVGRAADRRLPLVTVRLEKMRPARALEYFLADTQWIDLFSPPTPEQLDALVNAVQGSTEHPEAFSPERHG